jgi:hypothetical protein
VADKALDLKNRIFWIGNGLRIAGSPASTIAIAEFVVPRSMPRIFAIEIC